MICPLCKTDTNIKVLGPFEMKYYRCGNCRLLFADRASLPDLATEKARYQTHQNSPEDQHYVNFLNRTVTPTIPYLTKNLKVLDYGCGPGPAVDYILKQHGIECVNYDPIFFPKKPEGIFDAVISTECIEHFHNTCKEFEKMLSYLKPGGILTLMTDPYTNETVFEKWYYLKDPTHVSLFHDYTFEFIAKKMDLILLEKPERRVYVFQKRG